MSDEKEQEFFQIFNENRNIFLTGSSGTGKSFLVNKLRDKVRENDDIKIEITSTTGISSFLIKGRTIHSFSNIGILKPNQSVNDVIKKMKKNKDAIQRIKNCNVLVIDEISMLSKIYFDMLNQTFKIIRKSNLPFGNIKLIITGDFMQLKAIDDTYVFESDAWKELNLYTIILQKIYRQTDEKYIGILSRIRLGIVIPEDNVELFKRFKAYKETDFENIKVKPTLLTSTRIDVDNVNKEELDKINGDLVNYKAYDELKKDIISDSIAPLNLQLKIDSQVMITVNIDVENGIVNGSRGIITELQNDLIGVKLVNGENIYISRHQFTIEEDNKVIAIRNQFPIILAFCLTIHKCQGCSLDSAIIDIGYSTFGFHSVYVALSRVRSLEGLYLKSFIPSKIQVDPKAIEFYSKK